MTIRKPARLLLVDDDPGLLKLLGMRLVSEGYSVVTAESGPEALRVLGREKVDLVISDLRMDEMDGLQLFSEIQKGHPGMPVIILTAHGSIPDAVAATQQGVFSFLTKPVDKDALYKAIDEALEQRSPATDEAWRQAIVTRSPLMLRLLEQAGMVAQSDVSVLINGQSGTGKEIVAQAIHNASPRHDKPFVAINCGALPETLLETELFGYARGAFTGAAGDRPGLFEAASGGTLFLDEIGEMPPAMQVKLLRVLQEGEVRRVGEVKTRKVNVRILAATHRDLPAEIAGARFRQDLYYRLRVIEIVVPPLRQRRDDILPLARALLAEAAARNRRKVTSFSPAAANQLVRYAWPGNVRELGNAIERAVVLAAGDRIELADLPDELAAAPPLPSAAHAAHAVAGGAAGPGGELRPLAEVERDHILAALRACRGNRVKAAQQLQIGTATLYRKLKQYGGEGGLDSGGPDGESEDLAERAATDARRRADRG